MSTELQVILSELKARLSDLYGERLERLVLFGSQARGDAEPDSDIDVLVVLKGEVDPYAEIDRTLDITCSFSLERGVFVQLVFAPAQRLDHEMSPLFMNVRREGVEV